MTFFIALALLLLAICLGATGQIMLKAGLSNLGVSPTPSMVLMSLFRSGFVAGGFVCYAVSSLFYLLALSKLALSYAYPLVALSYVLVTILAWRLLNESVTPLRVVGLGIIMAGVVVVALSYRGTPPPDLATSTRSSVQMDAPE